MSKQKITSLKMNLEQAGVLNLPVDGRMVENIIAFNNSTPWGPL